MVTFNGDVFVVSWRVAIFNNSSSIIAGAHRYTTVTTAGVPGAMGTVAMLEKSDSLLYPVGIAGGGGRALIAYQILDRTPPYAIDRVKVAYLPPAPVPIGGRCPLNMGCAAGTCVDGICCETTCAGGATDCQACNIIAGAAQNGKCALLAAGTRPAPPRVCARRAGVRRRARRRERWRDDGGCWRGRLGGGSPAHVRPPDGAGGDATAGGDASGDGGRQRRGRVERRGRRDERSRRHHGRGRQRRSPRGAGHRRARGRRGWQRRTRFRCDVGRDGERGTGRRDGRIPPGGGCGCATSPPASDGLELAGCVVALLAALGRRRNRSR